MYNLKLIYAFLPFDPRAESEGSPEGRKKESQGREGEGERNILSHFPTQNLETHDSIHRQH